MPSNTPEKVEITRRALESALQGARETHPHEFVCLLRGEKKEGKWVIHEVIIPPFSSYERHSSGFSDWFIPANSNEIASFHSHPSPNSAFPSRQDLHFFSRSGKFHFIASAPYRIQDVNAFDSNGKRMGFQVV
ncbi:MAG: Mov34/MPN/PAD-1 family protein [Candidatus Micrarchaeota archaeon]